MSAPDHRRVARREITARLESMGFDLWVWGLGTALGELAEPLSIEPSSPLLLTGNTRALWPAFVAAQERGAACPPHPLDAYTEAAHQAALSAAPGAQVRTLWAHRGTPVLPIQRVAECLGLCHLGPAGLAVHPVYGPWFGLRALVVFPPGYLLSDDRAEPASVDLAARGVASAPCVGCAAPCRAAFDHARRTTERQSGSSLSALGQRGIAAHWRLWVAARDACPIGREHRYSAAQLAHHYGVAQED